MDWHSILATAFETLSVAVAAALAPYLVAWVVAQAKKVGLEVKAEEQQKLEYYAKQAILRAEEWAAKKAGISSLQKLSVATDDVIAATGVSHGAAMDAIHAVLPTMNLGAAAKKAASPLAQ